MCLLLVGRMATSFLPLASRLSFQIYMTEYLFKQNVLTISGEDGNELATHMASRLTFQLYITDYLYKRNVLTISGKDGD
jgi:hypothetical protein